jgi:hypothetical protein
MKLFKNNQQYKVVGSYFLLAHLDQNPLTGKRYTLIYYNSIFTKKAECAILSFGATTPQQQYKSTQHIFLQM